MKVNKKCLIFILSIFWITIIVILNKYDCISLITETMKDSLIINKKAIMITFVILWIIRLPILLPGVTLIILGGTLFGTINGAILSMTGMIISEPLIYVIAKVFPNWHIKDMIKDKYNHVEFLIKKYNYKFLALGILCPMAPTDIICFLSSSIGLNYVKYIVTIIICNIPIIMMYSYMGISYKGSLVSIAIILLSISVLALYTIRIWNELRTNEV